MRIACALLPDFEVAVELTRHLELAGRPVVVGGLPHERKRVRSCSPEAAAYGVAPGMSLRQARGLCPEAVFLPVEEELYRTSFDRLLGILERFSPTIEIRTEAKGLRTELRGAPNPRSSVLSPQSSFLAYLDAGGLEMLFGSDRELGQRIAAAVEEEMGLRPRVGLGGGRFVARVAALQAPSGSVLVVEAGREAAFLAPLPVGLLPCSEEMQRRMGLLGLRALGQLANLPEGALGEQFGPEGMEAQRLARGIESNPLVPREVPRLLEEEMEIDPPGEQMDLLLSAASALIERLSARMRSEYLACGEVALQLDMFGGPVRLSTTLHEATDEAGELMRAVGRLLANVAAGFTPARISGGSDTLPHEERAPIKGAATKLIDIVPPLQNRNTAISSLRISLSGFGSREEEQLGLFRSRADNLRRVRRAVERAEEQFGEGAIRPLAEMEGEKVVAIPLRVMVDEIGWPEAFILEGRRERVRELCNRWRVREEWWRREIYRDYFRLITEGGRLLVVYRDLTPQPPSDLSPCPSPMRGGEFSPFPRGEGGRGVRSAPWFLERVYG